VMADSTSSKVEARRERPMNKGVVVSSMLVSGFMLYHLYKKYANIPTKQWLTECPKIELHAHLHGSIRMSTLANLYEQASNDATLKHIIKPEENPKEKIQSILKEHKSFNEVFALFEVIHRVVCSENALVRIIHEVLSDFERQNVRYLELRSTPRALSNSGHTRADYVDIVLREIRNFMRGDNHKMVVRFIVTIQNAVPIEEAHESLDIIERYLKQNSDDEALIVGVDFAPRPIKGKTFAYYESVLQRARNLGLKVTVHFAEYYNRKEQDLVLNWRPERLGHAINITRDDYQYLLQSPIPIECCPTSNIFTKSIETYCQHPFKHLQKRFKQKYGNEKYYPLIVCTDDFGVFQTDLTSEWYKMCRAHHLHHNDVQQLTMNAIEFIFASENVKRQLRTDMLKAWKLCAC